MRRFNSDASFAGSGGPAIGMQDRPPGASTARAGMAERRRGAPRLRLHRRFLPLLVGVTLVSTFGLASLAYLGARSDAVSAAQTRALQDVQVERQLLSDQGAALSLQDGNLTIGQDTASTMLNGDTTLVDRSRSLVNADATIYQLDGPNLVAISTNVPQVNRSGQPISGSRALGDTLTGKPFHALLGTCGPIDTASCHQQYAGIVSIHGISYVAGYTPLYDMNGAFVGALGAAIPLDTVVAPSTQLAVVLLLVGLLVALGGLVTGFWLFGSLSRTVLQTLDAGLATVADSAGELEHLARAQVERANRHTRTALQVSEQVRALDALAGTMSQSQNALRESASEIWAEMSQPGLAPNPQVAMRLAQQAAVAAGKVGTSATEARDRCRQLVTLMNNILAESSVAGESGAEIERHARALRESVGQVEKALGKRLVQRQAGLSLPLLRRSGLRSPQGQPAEPGTSQPGDARPPHEQAPGRGQQTGSFVVARPWQTGALPAIRPEHLAGQNPYVTGKFPAQPRPGSQTGQPRTPGASHAGSGRFAEPGEWSVPPSASGSGQRKPPIPSTPLTGHQQNSSFDDLGLPGLPEEYRSIWKTDDADAGDAGNSPEQE